MTSRTMRPLGVQVDALACRSGWTGNKSAHAPLEFDSDVWSEA